jgi:hypothetical protein
VGFRFSDRTSAFSATLVVLYLSCTPEAPLNEFVGRMWLVSGGQSPRRERILQRVAPLCLSRDARQWKRISLHCSERASAEKFCGAFLHDICNMERHFVDVPDGCIVGGTPAYVLEANTAQRLHEVWTMPREGVIAVSKQL